MSRADGNRVMLDSAEEELRRAILAERAGVKNSGQRRQRVRVNDSSVRRAFGPDDEQEGLR